MQPPQESKWTTTLRCPQEVPPKAKATRIKVARKKKLKDPLPEFDEKSVPIHEVVEDVLKYMKKKEKVVAKINNKKTTKPSEKQDMGEVRNRIVQIESSIGHMEQNMNMLKELFDDMKRSNEIRNVKWETDLQNCMEKMETKSEKEKSKVVATLQKIHKEHSTDKKATDEHLKKVEHHAKKTTQSIVNGMQKLSDDLNHTKYDVDIM